MVQAEYDKLARRKAVAAAAHADRTTAVRRRIARTIVADPDRALAAATRTLSRKTAPQQQWSRKAWQEILQTKRPRQIAWLLLHARADQQALVDSHPFGGLATATNGR